MSFISGFTELFKGKKTETQAPQPNLDELKQHEANLTSMMAQGGKDFAHPADANALREVRNKIAELEGQQPTPPMPETPPPGSGITQIPVEQPSKPATPTTVEEPQAA